MSKHIQIKFSASMATVFAFTCLMTTSSWAETISGSCRLNSNRYAAISLRTATAPPANVHTVRLVMTRNNDGRRVTKTYFRPYGGWGSGYLTYSEAIAGMNANQYWYGSVDYFRDNGTNYTLYASGRAELMNAGRAGNLVGLTLSTYSVRGGQNGTQPAMTVTLDGPAQVGGQWIECYLVGTKARFLVSGWHGYWIPEGQTTGSQSWFIGTSNVVFNTSATLHAFVGNYGCPSVDLQQTFAITR
ncbi:MAG: hypothetical protein K1X67_01070 [Fimbriimonadaceae bacterium]|nr:hypothetical protein [Fimbriimonadaceae bacterium]